MIKVGTGGMVTKLEAARVAAVSGIPTVLTCASNAGPAMMGDPVGKPVLIIGERGTGKELIASRLHYLSSRWQGPFNSSSKRRPSSFSTR